MITPEPLHVGDRVEVRLTYDDYAALPDDGRRHQLLEGEIDVTPAPGTGHQRISRNLEVVLANHVRAHRLGAVYNAPIDVIIDAQTVVQPDLLFLCRERLSLVSERGIEGGPDLVVEVLSKHTRRTDRTTKMRIYGRAGVREYWLVDPEAQTAEVFAWGDGAYVLTAALTAGETLRSPMFPGLEIELAEVFAAD